MTQESPNAVLSSQTDSLKDKTILFVSSGNSDKRFIFRKARALGVRIILLNKDNNWATRYCDHFISADTYNHANTINKVEEFLEPKNPANGADRHPEISGSNGAGTKTPVIDGAVTFTEDDIPLLARLCRKFGWTGNSLKSALN